MHDAGVFCRERFAGGPVAVIDLDVFFRPGEALIVVLRHRRTDHPITHWINHQNGARVRLKWDAGRC